MFAIILLHKTVGNGCEYLQDPDYGQVTLTGTHTDARASYICDDGYELVGDDVRKCLHSGEWSGTEPICEKSKLEEL